MCTWQRAWGTRCQRLYSRRAARRPAAPDVQHGAAHIRVPPPRGRGLSLRRRRLVVGTPWRRRSHSSDQLRGGERQHALPRRSWPRHAATTQTRISARAQALRKQDFDLARFTDGVTPLGIIEPSDAVPWTPEQIETFERTFNGLLAGSDQMRVRAKMLPSGA
jgi:hypothetical protein